MGNMLMDMLRTVVRRPIRNSILLAAVFIATGSMCCGGGFSRRAANTSHSSRTPVIDPVIRNELNNANTEIALLTRRIEQLEAELSRTYDALAGSKTQLGESHRSVDQRLTPLELSVAKLEQNVRALQKHGNETQQRLVALDKAAKTNGDNVKSLDTAMRSIVAAVQGKGRGKTAIASASGATIYKVRSGDSLGKIAHQHNTTIDALIKANDLSRDDLIIIGQELRIP